MDGLRRWAEGCQREMGCSEICLTLATTQPPSPLPPAAASFYALWLIALTASAGLTFCFKFLPIKSALLLSSNSFPFARKLTVLPPGNASPTPTLLVCTRFSVSKADFWTLPLFSFRPCAGQSHFTAHRIARVFRIQKAV